MGKSWLCSLSMLLALQSVQAQTPAIEIELKNNTPTEQAARLHMQSIFAKYDLKPYVFTQRILIDDRSTPHSHPVLTLNTAYNERELFALATFVHEQFHWRVDELNDEKAKAAIAEFRRIFPEAPGRAGGGARDQFSTYLHLIVCDLEMQAMTRLAGEAQARETLRGYTHYPWIYQRVLDDPRIREVNRRFGFVL